MTDKEIGLFFSFITGMIFGQICRIAVIMLFEEIVQRKMKKDSKS